MVCFLKTAEETMYPPSLDCRGQLLHREWCLTLPNLALLPVTSLLQPQNFWAFPATGMGGHHQRGEVLRVPGSLSLGEGVLA